MIVGTFFEGDTSDLGWHQHEVYREALSVIVEGCRAHLRNACLMLGTPPQGPWPHNRSTDHRTMQDAHDLLAAAWRHLVYPTEPGLGQELKAKADAMSDWLEWLRSEVISWTSEPVIVAAVRTIIINQNTDAGYEAEEDLSRLLLLKFRHVPWTRPRLKA